MAWAEFLRRSGELLRQAETVAREVIGCAVETLLQSVIGIKRQCDRFRMPRERSFLLQLKISGKAAQAVHLVPHLAGGSIGRAAEACVQAAHPCEKPFEFRIERISCRGQLAFA